MTSALGIAVESHAYGVPCKRPSGDNSWNNVSVSSSGSTELKKATGGASLTSNKKVENLLMNDKRRGKSINHYRKAEKSRMIGEDVSSLETNGNAEIDIGSPALLKRSRRRRRHHGGCWGRPWGGRRSHNHWGGQGYVHSHWGPYGYERPHYHGPEYGYWSRPLRRRRGGRRSGGRRSGGRRSGRNEENAHGNEQENEQEKPRKERVSPRRRRDRRRVDLWIGEQNE